MLKIAWSINVGEDSSRESARKEFVFSDVFDDNSGEQVRDLQLPTWPDSVQ